jgi:hypothetical protein
MSNVSCGRVEEDCQCEQWRSEKADKKMAGRVNGASGCVQADESSGGM